MDLRGYIVTDNRGQGDQRQSGPQFRDIDKWAHVRSGTIIVIRHGTVAEVRDPDSLEADGYLELSQFDTRYFRIVNVDGAAGSNGMNINVDRDFVQILKPDSSHCHGLSHTITPSATWDATGSPKAAYETLNLGAARSVWVSGRSLAAYGAGLGTDSTSIGINSSRGFPNGLDNLKLQAGLVGYNHLFWRELREPEWSATPVVTLVQQTPDRHVISWTSLVDTWTSDRTTGYMILRDTLNFAQFPTSAIRDGAYFNVGQKIGTATVIALKATADGTTYTDANNLLCGVNYTYRIYGYRFEKDDKLTLAATLDTTARGRQFSESVYAQSSVIQKPNPTKPNIFASKTNICPGDTVTLTTDVMNAKEYLWTLDAQPLIVPGTTTIVVGQAGTYRLRVVADGGCFADSDPLVIGLLPAQVVETTPAGPQYICDGESITLTAKTTAASYEWLFNGVTIPGETKSSISVKAAGEYRVRTATSQGCPGISSVITVNVRDVRYHFEPATLDVGQLGACQTSTFGTVELINDGTETITISSITMPTGFALASPAPGFSVAAGERRTIRILFAPSTNGVISGTAQFVAQPCSVTVTLPLRGERTEALASLDRAGVDFGVYTACPNSDIRPDSAFVITNEGSSSITIKAPLLSPPFYLLTQFITRDLAAGESFEIRVQYRPLGPDLDRGVSQEMAFPFVSTTCSDTLKATLQGASYLPRLTAAEANINVGAVLSCIGYADSVVTISNPSPVAAVLDSSVSSFVSIIGAPITVEPGTTISVRIRITPTPVTGPFTILDTLIGSPCNIRVPIRFSGRYVDPSFSTSPNTVELGPVDLCGSVSTATSTVMLYANSGIGLRSTITSVDVGLPFSTNLTVGSSIIDSLQVTITYAPTQPGFDVDTLQVVFGPCGDTVHVVLRGEATQGAASFPTLGLPLPVIGLGESADFQQLIVNGGGGPITVEPLFGITPPFSILSEQPSLPAVLAPGDTVVVTIRYSYAGPDRVDTLNYAVGISGICGDTVRATAIGRTRGDTTIILTGLTIVIPDDVTTVMGTQVDVPVFLTSQQPLIGKGLQSMSVVLLYNATLFEPLTAQASQGEMATITETQPGRAVLNVSTTSEYVESATQPLATIRGNTFLGSARQTPLVVDTVISAQAVIEGQDGQLILSGDCAIESQVITRGLPPSIRVVSVRDRDVTMEITTLTDDPATISVVDAGGRLVREEVLVVRPGVHVLRLQLPTSSGMFIGTMSHGLYHGSVSFIAVR
jgi:hypothetical protein